MPVVYTLLLPYTQWQQTKDLGKCSCSSTRFMVIIIFKKLFINLLCIPWDMEPRFRQKTKQAIWSLKAFQVPRCFTGLLMNISTAQQLTLLVSSLSSSLSSCSACYWCLHQPVRKDAPAAVACPSRACRFHGSPSGSTTGRLCARTPTTCFLPLVF